ncbi:MAG: hypothetical protein ACLUI3_13025 [Christensenellales bacterium]
MKHIRLFASFFALMMMLCAGASAEITITKRDINMNTALDKNVSNILVPAGRRGDRHDDDRLHQQPDGALGDAPRKL